MGISIKKTVYICDDFVHSRLILAQLGELMDI